MSGCRHAHKDGAAGRAGSKASGEKGGKANGRPAAQVGHPGGALSIIGLSQTWGCLVLHELRCGRCWVACIYHRNRYERVTPTHLQVTGSMATRDEDESGSDDGSGDSGGGGSDSEEVSVGGASEGSGSEGSGSDLIDDDEQVGRAPHVPRL